MFRALCRSLCLIAVFLAASSVRGESYSYSSLMDYITHASQGTQEASRQFAKDEGLLLGAKAASTTPRAEAYLRMEGKLADMGTSLRAMRASQRALEGKRSSLDLIFGGSDAITSADRRWPRLSRLVLRLEEAADRFNEDNGYFWEDHRRFEGHTRRAGIKSVPVQDLMRQAESKKGDRRSKREDAKKKAQNASAWTKTGLCEAPTMAALEVLLKGVVDAWEAYEREFTRLTAPWKGKDAFYEGPGIAQVTLLTDLETAGKDTGDKYEEFLRSWKTMEGQAKAALKAGRGRR